MSALKMELADHEAFKNTLVEDVLGTDASDKVPMEKVVMLIWAFRDDPTVVTFMARFVAKYAGSRHVFDGIEFYLPQLAHMIIHLEVDWDDAILERFALVIAQQSLHFALQLNWILQGSLRDYQPELPDGSPNPTYHALFYSRCLVLLKNVERCVVYGKPRAAELQRLYETGKITKKELIILEQADRRFNALQIQAIDDAGAAVDALDGWVSLQLPQLPPPLRVAPGNTSVLPPTTTTTSSTLPPRFVSRFCVLEKNVLNCYTPRNCGCGPNLKLDRAMSLERAKVTTDEAKLLIKVTTTFYTFAMQLSQLEEMKLWARRLDEEAELSALFTAHHRSSELKADLTPAQLDRYDFFQNERLFIDHLTQVAEDLRFHDRPSRKILAPGLMEALEIPPTVYLPLCNSSDIWRRVACTVAKETRVFNTKARCPVVMHFISKRGEAFRGQQLDATTDVAEWMHNYLEVAPEENPTGEKVMEQVKEEDEKEEEDAVLPSSTIPALALPTNDNEDAAMIDSQHSISVSSVWRDEDREEEDAVPLSDRIGPRDGGPTSPGGKRGNRRVQRLLRESVVTLPNMLAKRLKPKASDSIRRRVSVMDRQTQIQPLVPILENNRPPTASGMGNEDTENGSVGDGTAVSAERSSVLCNDQFVLGDLGAGEIDVHCIDRATKFVGGGESYAARSWRMLEGSLEMAERESDQVQLEILSCLAKSNDDLRQEVFVMQMIHYYKSVFAQAKLPLWLKTYRILSTSKDTGLLELITDSTSLDGLKKSGGYPEEGGLRKYFEMVYGAAETKTFKAAQTNFMQSLAGYSLVAYLLGLKDRHNGNIMIDTLGRVIFIDFGFAFGMKPGHEFSFERAPFKLTKEYVELMDGVGSECYKKFEHLFVEGFVEARKHSQIALGLVEIMMYKSNYPCFSGSRYGKGRALISFEKRLMLTVPDDHVKRRAAKLVRKSRQHLGTYLYDAFQKATNGYAI